jgi:hypothetical protein
VERIVFIAGEPMMNLSRRERNRVAFSVALLAGLLASTGGAQTTTTPGSTSPTPPAVSAFNIERVTPLNSISSTLTPKLDPATLAAVQSGALEIREQINYNAQNQVLTVNLFTAQPGAPLPTPAGSNISKSTFSTYTISVDKVYLSTTPNPSVLFVGTVGSNTPASPFGNLSGAAAAVSIGYTSDTPPKINNVVTLVAGTYLDYTASATGTLTFTSNPITPPGSSGGAGPVISVVEPGVTTFRAVTLDASKSTGTPTLKFQWSVVAGAADVGNATTSVATGYIYGGAGTYTFKVTVTDGNGVSATKTIDVQFQ